MRHHYKRIRYTVLNYCVRAASLKAKKLRPSQHIEHKKHETYANRRFGSTVDKKNPCYSYQVLFKASFVQH